MKNLRIGFLRQERARERPLHQVERALRARFRQRIQNRDRSRLSRFNFFTAPGGEGLRSLHRSAGVGSWRQTPPEALCALPLKL